MSLLQDWREKAYSKEMDSKEGEIFWKTYFEVEKEIYGQLLENPNEIVEGSVSLLAQKYNTSVFLMTGFLDGINDSLVAPNEIEELSEDTIVSLNIDIEKLYYNMVEAKADWLYKLPVWDTLISEARRKELYNKQKKSNTIINDKKIGRNELCPCGSGKKYKFCCGK